MKISIIVPVYNSEKFLDNLIKSIESQVYNDYEVVFVNDGSTDNSLNIINRYKKKNFKIKCLTIKNSGPGIARKVGFQNSSGELLFFIDSDDYLPNNQVLKKIVNIYEKEKFDIMFFNYVFLCDKQEKISNAFYGNTKNIKLGMNNIQKLHNISFDGALWQKIFVRKKMNSSFFYNSFCYEDFYTTYVYLNNCECFYYSDEILYYANRDNELSISKKTDLNKILESINILKQLMKQTKFKEALSFIIYDFYNYSRRQIDKGILSKEDKLIGIKKLKELKKYFNFKLLIKVKAYYVEYLKYIYYIIKDILIGV